MASLLDSHDEDRDDDTGFAVCSEHDPDGPPCIERECTGCGREYLVNLYFSDTVPPDSWFNQCPRCQLAIRAQGRRIRAQHAARRNRT